MKQKEKIMKKVFLSLLALLIVLSSLMLVPVTASTAEKNVLEIVLNVPGFDPSFFRWALTGQNNGYIKMNDQDIASITTVSEDGKTATIRYMSDEPIEFGTYKIDVFGFMIYLHSFNIEINAESGSTSVTSDAGEPGTVSWTISKVTVEEGKLFVYFDALKAANVYTEDGEFLYSVSKIADLADGAAQYRSSNRGVLRTDENGETVFVIKYSILNTLLNTDILWLVNAILISVTIALRYMSGEYKNSVSDTTKITEANESDEDSAGSFSDFGDENAAS
jgi:hypothetical protein